MSERKYLRKKVKIHVWNCAVFVILNQIGYILWGKKICAWVCNNIVGKYIYALACIGLQLKAKAVVAVLNDIRK